jgi:polyisoprenoid-binding protein YceI
MSWTIDPAHTRVVFSVKHMMITSVHGSFDKVNGRVDFDPAHPEKAHADLQIEAASINTREPQRDAHLRSPDFLDAEKYPALIFKSRRVELVNQSRGRLVGDLTIRDLTREVALDVEYNGIAKNPWGMAVAGFTASTKINRKDWNLTWNVALETGGWLVGDTISINIELEIVKQPEADAVSIPELDSQVS